MHSLTLKPFFSFTSMFFTINLRKGLLVSDGKEISNFSNLSLLRESERKVAVQYTMKENVI